MPFTYEDSLQGERRNALTIPSARSEVLTEQFAISFEENPVMAYRRFSELAEDQVTGPRLSADTARARLKDAGMENDLTVAPGGISEKALLTLMDRKRVEKRRQEIFSRSEGGLTEGAARFGVAVATTLSDPISAGLNFVPVVGQARYARWLNAARSIGGRAAVRVGVGAAEGAAGAAIAEVPIYAMRTQEQADYDMVDSLLNVTLGGVIGAGLHATVGTAAEVLARRRPTPEVTARAATSSERIEPTIGEPARAPEPLPDDIQRMIFQPGSEGAVARMPPMARERALREAVAQAVEGRAIDVNLTASLQEPITANWDSTSRSSSDRARHNDTPYVNKFVEHEEGITTHAATAADLTEAETIGGMPAKIGRDEISLYRKYDTAEWPKQAVIDAQRRLNGIKTSTPDYVRVGYLKMASDGGIEHIVVSPQFRRTGLASALLQEAQARFGLDPLKAKDRSAEGAALMESLRKRMLTERRSESADASAAADLRAAAEHAETTLARETEGTPEAVLVAAEDEAKLAMADVTELAKRLDVDVKSDPEMAAALEGAEKAERWARVAELATVCLVRGG